MSYIIKDGRLVAKTEETLRSGELVRISPFWTIESCGGKELLNPRFAKISNAKKWDRIYRINHAITTAEFIEESCTIGAAYKEYIITYLQVDE